MSCSGKNFKCEQCNYSSNRSFDLRRHERRHTKIKPAIEGAVFKCSECSFTTKWKRNIARHMNIHNKTVVEEDAMEDPIEEPGDEEIFEEFIVELIGDSDTNASSNATETQTHSRNSEKLGITRMKFFVCGQCQYTTNRTYDMRRHEQTHLREKIIEGTAFKCLKCSFITKWKRNMTQHLKKHVEFSNKVFLEQFSDNSSDGIIVQRVNSDDVRTECDKDPVDNTCSDNSQSQPSLLSCQSPNERFEEQTTPPLEAKSNGQRRFKCKQCNYESKRTFDLRRHEQSHDKVKIIYRDAVKCTECSYVTKWKRNMRRHMEKHKPKLDPTETNIMDMELVEEEKSYKFESQTLLTESLVSETDISEYNSETITINEVDLYEEIKSELELKILESDNDPDILPSYWHTI